eukprot:RCo052515
MRRSLLAEFAWTPCRHYPVARGRDSARRIFSFLLASGSLIATLVRVCFPDGMLSPLIVLGSRAELAELLLFLPVPPLRVLDFPTAAIPHVLASLSFRAAQVEVGVRLHHGASSVQRSRLLPGGVVAGTAILLEAIHAGMISPLLAQGSRAGFAGQLRSDLRRLLRALLTAPIVRKGSGTHFWEDLAGASKGLRCHFADFSSACLVLLGVPC